MYFKAIKALERSVMSLSTASVISISSFPITVLELSEQMYQTSPFRKIALLFNLHRTLSTVWIVVSTLQYNSTHLPVPQLLLLTFDQVLEWHLFKGLLRVCCTWELAWPVRCPNGEIEWLMTTRQL